jgi:hypothetical protein
MAAAEITFHPNLTVRISSPWGFPVREDVAFTDSHGEENHRHIRRLQRALEKLQEPLARILEPGETVLFCTRGQIIPDHPERYLLGVQSHYLSPSALILTNRRFLQLSLKRNGRWRQNLRSACWADVKASHITGLLYGKLHLEFRQGAKETYWRISKDAAKKIQFLLGILLPASAGEAPQVPSVANLCPQCLTALAPGIFGCHHCQQQFKDEKTAVLLTLLVPGGGYFYVGYNLWGVYHAIIDVGLFLNALLWLLLGLGIIPLPSVPGARSGISTSFLLAALSAALLALDTWLAIRVARKAVRNFIPQS